MKTLRACVMVLCGLLPTLGHAATEKLNLLTAWCDGSTAYSAWDLPSSGGMMKVCLSGTGVSYGALTAPHGATPAAFFHFRWPSDFLPTQPIVAQIELTGSMVSTNHIAAGIAIACVADGGSLLNLNPSFPTPSGYHTAGPSTAGEKRTIGVTVSLPSNCQAGNLVIFKLVRLGTNTSDTYTWDAQFLNVEVSYSRQ